MNTNNHHGAGLRADRQEGGVKVPVTVWALAPCSAGLVLRLRSVADDECQEDGWLSTVLRQSADEIERLRAGLEKIVQGGYADGADVAHPAIRVARDTLDPLWREKARQRAESHYPTTSSNVRDEPRAGARPQTQPK